ncbi:MAG: ubiquinone biosynthesis protein [Myxococcota bacterium]|jgi:ubiquinone biosynthesis protein
MMPIQTENENQTLTAPAPRTASQRSLSTPRLRQVIGDQGSTLWAFGRLTRASWHLGIILASYLTQRGLTKVFGDKRLAKRALRVHDRNAKRLYTACIRLRGVYIKMGQVLSIMGTFLPAAYAAELEKLQDKVPARPFSAVSKAIQTSLGAPPHIAFASFDETPVAAASLGQVHRAVTHDGDEVAVKVLYPNVHQIMRIDLRVLAWALKVYGWFAPIAQLDRLHAQLTEMLEQETDFAHEACSLDKMAKNFADDDQVVVPSVHHSLSTNKVLTMTFMDGVKISDLDGLASLGIEPQAVARKLVEIFYKQVFFDGFFHADPHPGNFFAQRGPNGEVRIVILDLGSATQTRAPLVDGLMDILAGFMAKNDDQVMGGIERMGFLAANGDRGLLERTVKGYFERLLNLDLTDFGSIGYDRASELADTGLKGRELRRLMRSIEYPEGWFYLERASVILFGLSAQLAPKLNLFQVGFPFVARYVADRARRGA